MKCLLINIVLNLKTFITTFVIPVDFYIGLLYRGGRMGGAGDWFRLVSVYLNIYLNIYALLLY